VDWPIETYLLLGLALSVVLSVGGVVVIGIVLVKLPSGYFRDSDAPQPRLNVHPFVRWGAVLVKNLLGSTLVLLGILMSVPGVPGPGIVTVVLGLMLLDFAQKKRWATWVMRREPILWAANSLRRKYGKPPFVMPSNVSR
jgi:hypothetical protein